MTVIELDRSKLLGFRLVDAVEAGALPTGKVGGKPPAATRAKVSIKLGAKVGTKGN